MSHSPLTTHLSTLCCALSVAMFPLAANAVTVGETKIISEQNEPLLATIEVSDIDPNNFSAKVAQKLFYQKMGLNSDLPTQVNFVQTTANAGHLVVTSNQAVNEPFADLVLLINDGTKVQAIPKTLLMPLVQSNQFESNRLMAATATAPVNKSADLQLDISELSGLQTQPKAWQPLAIARTAPAVATIGQPLVVKRTAPPPLFPLSPSASEQQSDYLASVFTTPDNTSSVSNTTTFEDEPELVASSPSASSPVVFKSLALQPSTQSSPLAPAPIQLDVNEVVEAQLVATTKLRPLKSIAAYESNITTQDVTANKTKRSNVKSSVESNNIIDSGHTVKADVVADATLPVSVSAIDSAALWSSDMDDSNHVVASRTDSAINSKDDALYATTATESPNSDIVKVVNNSSAQQPITSPATATIQEVVAQNVVDIDTDPAINDNDVVTVAEVIGIDANFDAQTTTEAASTTVIDSAEPLSAGLSSPSRNESVVDNVNNTAVKEQSNQKINVLSPQSDLPAQLSTDEDGVVPDVTINTVFFESLTPAQSAPMRSMAINNASNTNVDTKYAADTASEATARTPIKDDLDVVVDDAYLQTISLNDTDENIVIIENTATNDINDNVIANNQSTNQTIAPTNIAKVSNKANAKNQTLSKSEETQILVTTITRTYTVMDGSGTSHQVVISYPESGSNQELASNRIEQDTKLYRVKHRDSLWSIAKRVADKNDANIFTVMKAIKKDNAHAFVDNDRSKLIANVAIKLPTYDKPAAVTTKVKSTIKIEPKGEIALAASGNSVDTDSTSPQS